MRKVSKTSKKGSLERVYKKYTLPLVFKKNFGLCVVCGLRRAESGHHILGRSEDFYHINENFVLPVCITCHSKEKSTSKNHSLFFHKKIMDYLAKNPIIIGKTNKDNWVINKIKEFGV